jgi:hypothetical protein
MKIVCFLLKLVLKILLLPVAFLLRFLCFIWNLLMQLSLWVLSPVMLFVLGCGIYSVVRASWTDVFLLTLIEMGLFAAAVGAGGESTHRDSCISRFQIKHRNRSRNATGSNRIFSTSFNKKHTIFMDFTPSFFFSSSFYRTRLSNTTMSTGRPAKNM